MLDFESLTHINTDVLRENAWLRILQDKAHSIITQVGPSGIVPPEAEKFINDIRNMESNWQELGFKPDKLPSRGEVKQNYRLLSLKHHPDRNPGDNAAEQKFKNVANAYEGITRIHETIDEGMLAEVKKIQDHFTTHQSNGGWVDGYKDGMLGTTKAVSSIPVDHLSGEQKDALAQALRKEGYKIEEHFSKSMGSNVLSVVSSSHKPVRGLDITQKLQARAAKVNPPKAAKTPVEPIPEASAKPDAPKVEEAHTAPEKNKSNPAAQPNPLTEEPVSSARKDTVEVKPEEKIKPPTETPSPKPSIKPADATPEATSLPAHETHTPPRPTETPHDHASSRTSGSSRMGDHGIDLHNVPNPDELRPPVRPPEPPRPVRPPAAEPVQARLDWMNDELLHKPGSLIGNAAKRQQIEDILRPAITAHVEATGEILSEDRVRSATRELWKKTPDELNALSQDRIIQDHLVTPAKPKGKAGRPGAPKPRHSNVGQMHDLIRAAHDEIDIKAIDKAVASGVSPQDAIAVAQEDLHAERAKKQVRKRIEQHFEKNGRPDTPPISESSVRKAAAAHYEAIYTGAVPESITHNLHTDPGAGKNRAECEAERKQQLKEKLAKPVPEPEPVIEHVELNGAPKRKARVPSAASIEHGSNPGFFQRTGGAIMEKGGAIVENSANTIKSVGKGAKNLGGGIAKAAVLTTAAGVGLAVLPGLLNSPVPPRRLNMGGSSGESAPLEFSNATTEIGALSVPKAEQQQAMGSWVSRLPSLQDMAAMQDISSLPPRR